MSQLFEEKEITQCDQTTEQLSELQSSIHDIERKIRFTESEKKADVEVYSLDLKKNNFMIKQLMMEVKELEVRIKESEKADENKIKKYFKEHSRNLGNFKGKSAKEAICLIEADVLELDKKCKALKHELQVLKREQVCDEQQLRMMEIECNEDFENETTEYDSLQRIRELENEQQKVNKDIVECEIAQNRYKTMKEQLLENQLSYPFLLLDVEKEYKTLQEKTNNLKINEIQNNEFQANLESGDGTNRNGKDVVDHNETLKLGKAAFVSEPSTPIEQRTEIEEIQEQFEKIKEVTCVSDIQNAKGRILAQKSMHEELLDLKKRLIKSLHELKTQKKSLDIRMALIRKANSEGPIKERLDMAKSRLDEQEKRKVDANAELDKMNSLLKEIKVQLSKVLQLLQSQSTEVNAAKRIMDVSDIIKEIENILLTNFRKD